MVGTKKYRRVLKLIIIMNYLQVLCFLQLSSYLIFEK